MTLIEYFDKKLEEENTKQMEENNQKIIEYLDNNLKASIKLKGYGISDVLKFKENPNNYFEQTPILTIDQNGIIMSAINPDQTKLIISNLNQNIEYLELPHVIFNLLELNHYPKLKKIFLNPHNDNINIDQIKSIFNSSNIEEIGYGKTFDDNILKEMTYAVCNGKLEGRFNGKRLYGKDLDFSYGKKATLYSKELDKDMATLFELLNKTDTSNLQKAEFYDQDPNQLLNEPVYSIEYTKNDKNDKECTLTVNHVTEIKNVNSFIDRAKQNDYKIDNVVLNLENKNYEDIEMLYDISEKYNLTIKADYNSMNLNDFVSMRETLNYYKDLISQRKLSPLEKATYGYDIVKSFVYRESEEKSESREISKIIKTGNIVCVGYSQLYVQLMKEIGINGASFSTIVPIDERDYGHQRCVLNINDDKYNVHGTYAFDPTWDSASGIASVVDEEDKEKLICTYDTDLKEGQRIVKRYDDISRYKYFLIGKEEYPKVFKGERMSGIEDYDLSTKTLSPDQFTSLITNVKLAEGYPMYNIEETVNDVLEVNGLKKREVKGTHYQSLNQK